MHCISVIVPCFNEEDVLQAFHQEVTKELQTIDHTTYELIFVNDGSSDHTQDILESLSQVDPHCSYYTFSRNFGKEAAMYAGLKQAKGDLVVIMDADLQHPPRLLKPMAHAILDEHYDCCAGKRIDRQGEGKLRNFLSHSFYKIIHMQDGAGDFRMMSRQMVDAILECKEYNRYMKGIFSFVGFDTKWIPFHNVERVGGRSKWNLKSLFTYALQGIYSFSDAPIQWCMGIGLISLLASFIFLPIRPIVFFLMFFGGLQILCLSAIGEYASKCYLESKNRPIYIIKKQSQAREIQK
ncbi:MAG: glycosyltransferase family 2 protein [Absicoccus sp.]|uniref:glycosyltransferase family 2 protein n=1 Tax=Absicoccus sp. TaxID=2718527 RepID=UPI002A753EC2|nr:glycosyltransferase family 2 protein [Absicoccus sp.]MDY3035750.1 glycosyltransferase family 2 protein [Absicoccus sp.]